MRIVNVLLRMLGVMLLLLFGVLFLSLSLRLIRMEDVTHLLFVIDASQEIRLILGAVGGVVVGAMILFSWMIVQQFQKERTIAFRNPDGEVTVSLEAIEDFIKRLAVDFEGVREIKPNVKATRSGILVRIRAALWADAQIPETTEGLQGIIHSHIRDMLGVEEPVSIHVHVGKVVPRIKKEKTAEEKIL